MRAHDSIAQALLTLAALATAAGAQAAGNSHLGLRHEADLRLVDDEGEDDENDDDEAPDGPQLFVERFEENPLDDDDAVVSGDALSRLTWNDDAPAWPGDAPGSLDAAYQSNDAAGLFGFPLATPYDDDEAFTAAAAFVIHSAGFDASPDGFFQISWGLWSTAATGLDRTGSFTTTADAFESIGFDWFPNVSPFFGGPFLSPVAFGAADLADPDFAFSGAFANFSSVFGFAFDLPRDVPLYAVLEHRPDLDTLSVQVYRIVSSEAVVPLDGGVVNLGLGGLAPRQYALDAVGLMLWHDGFGGATPAVEAELTYHTLVVAPGVTARPEEWLHVED